MRPLKLELEAFTAFRQPLCVDFGGLDLFAITGPTGAGKSSLIDAIAYALYGRVPRVADKVGACISQGFKRMWVELEFLAGEDRYRIHRETRTAGAPSTRLERWSGQGWAELEVAGAARINQRVAEIVGLDFDGFIRSVLLPQGHFQEFLAGDPSKKREVLAQLLRLDVYERIRRRARQEADELRARIAGIQQAIEKAYANATVETAARLERELEELRSEARSLEGLTGQLEGALELAKEIAKARAELADARRQLDGVAEKQRMMEELIQTGDQQISALEGALQAVKANLEANPFDPARLSALNLAAHIHGELEKTLSGLTAARVALTSAQQAHEAAARAVEAASGQLAERHAEAEAAEGLLQASMKANAAVVVQQGLTAGDACPVCGAVVTELPHIECPDLSEAQAARASARKGEDAARNALAQAQTQREVAAEKCQGGQRQIEELQSWEAQLGADLARAIPDGDRSKEAIEGALRAQQQAQEAREALQRERERIEAELQRLKSDRAQAEGGLAALRGQAQALTETARQAEARFGASLQALRSLAADTPWGEPLAGVDAGEPLEAAIRQGLKAATARQLDVQTSLRQTQQQLEETRARIGEKRETEQELAKLGAQHDVAADLAEVMQANRFGAFVQSEALRVLAQEGSGKLEGLSAGRYRLRVADKGQDFEVMDQWNADESRSVKTLSGGETFLASLALALTMAESLPGLAPGQRVVLDSMFIDEGFGSLDAEALDRAADALDSLRASNRMVCVVTHLKELADRLPARITVHRSESGSTVEVA